MKRCICMLLTLCTPSCPFLLRGIHSTKIAALVSRKTFHSTSQIDGPSKNSSPAASSKQKSIYPSVSIKKGKARLFWSRNPLVFGGAVLKVTGNPSAGDIVEVKSSADQPIGWGVYNENSMFRVRILSFDNEVIGKDKTIGKLVEQRCDAAIRVRRTLGLPSAETDSYRCINGEGDRLSGIVVDVFRRTVCVLSSALWVEVHRNEIERAIRNAFGEDYFLLWRRSNGRLEQDGWAAPPNVADEEESAEAEQTRLDSMQKITELGLTYNVDPFRGQKTGFYLDQRENRSLIRRISSGKKVLDMFCYTGGFSLNAAVGGAREVKAVDSSQKAIDTGRVNAEANNVTYVDFERADAIEWMKNEISSGGRYDIVILDPPKLAPNKKTLTRATTMYTRLNSLALKLVSPNGYLVTFSCSAAMAQSGEFISMVNEASIKSNREIVLVQKLGPSSDHVLNPAYLEGDYLIGGMFVCK